MAPHAAVTDCGPCGGGTGGSVSRSPSPGVKDRRGHDGRSCPSGPPCPGQPAFTLLELIVVLAMIALLAGLLLPCLGAGKEQARRTICACNLRRLGIALTAYAAENRGWYPVEELCGNPQRALVESLYENYVPDRGLFYCPSAGQIEQYAQSNEYPGPGGDSVVNTEENWQRRYITYKYFSVTQRDTRMPLPLRLSEYPHLLRIDCPQTRWLMSDWVRKDVPVFPHWQKGGWGGGRNVLFADKSVQFVQHRTPYAFTERQ